MSINARKKFISALLALAMTFTLIPGAIADDSTDDSGIPGEEPVAVTGVSLSQAELTLYLGVTESHTLIATVEPGDAVNKEVSWGSTDSSVAAVTNGKITAISGGEATITVTTQEGSHSATCKVKVLPAPETVAAGLTAVTNPQKGDSALSLPSVPEGFGVKIDSTSQPEVISVTGKITPAATDTDVELVLLVTREDGKKAKSGQITVTVPAKEAEIKKVTSITISSSKTIIRENESLQLIVNIIPDNAADKTYKWTVSGAGKAKINSADLLIPEKAGKVTVKATAQDGSKVSGAREITIISASTVLVSGILVKGEDNETSVEKGKTLKMIATIYPSNASNKSITWSVVNGSGEAKITSAGVLTGVLEGNVTVIAKAKDVSGVEEIITIKVTKSKEEEGLVDKSGGTIKEGDVTVVVPKDAVDREIEITIGRVSSRGLAIPDNYKIVSDIYYISKSRSADFKKAVTVTIPFNKRNVEEKKDKLSLYIWDEDHEKWVALSSIRVNWSEGTVRGAIDRLGKFAALVEVAAPKPVAPAPQPAVTVLKDINTHWAKSPINQLVALGAIQGYPDNTFRPDQMITRAEFAAVLVKAFNVSADSQKVFNDTRGHWAQIQIASAYKAGIISGYDQLTFGPDDPITREQMAVMAVKAAKPGGSSTTLKFKDSNAVSPWAKASVGIAVNRGLLTGYPDNSFKPAGRATRAEAVAVTVLAIK